MWASTTVTVCKVYVNKGLLLFQAAQRLLLMSLHPRGSNSVLPYSFWPKGLGYYSTPPLLSGCMSLSLVQCCTCMLSYCGQSDGGFRRQRLWFFPRWSLPQRHRRRKRMSWKMNPCRFCSTLLWGHNTDTRAPVRSSWKFRCTCSGSGSCRAAGEGCRPSWRWQSVAQQ